MSDEEECPPCPAGMPAWVMTFADLMSLLMCFFVLLLAFSEMDVMKYKQVAGSMRDAFGVQNEIKKKDIPRGTSVVAQEFSPGRPDPTPLNEVRQKTTDMTRSTLDVICEKNSESIEEGTEDVGGGNESGQVIMINKLEELVEKTQVDAMSIAEALEEEIRNGQVEVETNGQEIIIRVRENGSFPSGSATLQGSFIPIMAKIRKVLALTPGKISVEGHSDNVPIHTDRFRSNWDLSSARAVSVAHELLLKDELSAERLSVSGYADTKPLLPNESRRNMAVNRRVEIIISQTDLLQDERERVDLDAEADFQGDVQDSLKGTANVNTREDEINRDLSDEGAFEAIRGPMIRIPQANNESESAEPGTGNAQDENVSAEGEQANNPNAISEDNVSDQIVIEPGAGAEGSNSIPGSVDVELNDTSSQAPNTNESSDNIFEFDDAFEEVTPVNTASPTTTPATSAQSPAAEIPASVDQGPAETFDVVPESDEIF
ncbi:MAG: hypothetical protein COB04_17330 [Gammaproteobacteria bacterium]|nr:MAG: hypothetical protein COB04_17330 [Gammaproteobacteria bacterium]